MPNLSILEKTAQVSFILRPFLKNFRILSNIWDFSFSQVRCSVNLRTLNSDMIVMIFKAKISSSQPSTKNRSMAQRQLFLQKFDNAQNKTTNQPESRN